MYKTTILVGLMVLSGAAAAAEKAPAVGEQTQQWLQLQKSGSASVGERRPMPGEVADPVYKRYVDSFTHPIPESYNRKRFVEGE